MSHPRTSLWLVLTVALMMLGARPAAADDIAVLPLGDPSRAYLLGAGEARQILDCRLAGADGAGAAPVVLEPAALAKELAGADVVIIGEHHTNIDGHRMQAKILDAIAATGQPFALGMEFLYVGDDAALAQYSAGKSSMSELLDAVGWFSGGNYSFEYYRPLLETCGKHKAPIYGLNIPRDWVRTVSRQGIDALKDDQRSYVGEVGPVDPRHKYIINQMMGGIGTAMPEMFEGMYRGQTTWDAAMAASILRAHKENAAKGTKRMIVVIVGSGHMAHGLAIPARLHAMDPSLTVRTIAPVNATKPDEDARVHPGFEKKETAVFSRGYADFVYILPDDGGAEEYPAIGARFAASTDGATPSLRLSSVTPGGIADRAGLRKGDEVLGIGEERPTTVSQAGEVIGSLRWNQRVMWRIKREGADAAAEIAMLVVPPTDADGDWLKSKPASMLLDSFDPTSDRSYAEPPKTFKPAGPQARLVTFRSKPVRIDVVNDGVLMETWNLDAAGRPVLGLMSRPGPDGAVRVEIDRDESGKVTATRRVDAGGKAIKGAKDVQGDEMK